MSKDASTPSDVAPPPYTFGITPSNSEEEMDKSDISELYDEWLVVEEEKKKLDDCDSDGGHVKIAMDKRSAADEDADADADEASALVKKNKDEQKTVEKNYKGSEVYEMLVRQQRRLKIEHILIMQRFLFMAIALALTTIFFLTMLAIYHDSCLDSNINEYHQKNADFKLQIDKLDNMTQSMQDKVRAVLVTAKDVYLEDCKGEHPLITSEMKAALKM